MNILLDMMKELIKDIEEIRKVTEKNRNWEKKTKL